MYFITFGTLLTFAFSETKVHFKKKCNFISIKQLKLVEKKKKKQLLYIHFPMNAPNFFRLLLYHASLAVLIY